MRGTWVLKVSRSKNHNHPVIFSGIYLWWNHQLKKCSHKRWHTPCWLRNRERDLLVEKNCYSRRRFCTTEKLHCWSTEWLVVILNLKPSMYDIPWDLRHVCWPNSYSHYCRLSLSNGKNIPTVISFVNICMNYHSIFFLGEKK